MRKKIKQTKRCSEKLDIDELSNIPYPTLRLYPKASRQWLVLSKEEQRALIDAREEMLNHPFYEDYSEYIICVGDFFKEPIPLNHKENKILTLILENCVRLCNRAIARICHDIESDIRRGSGKFLDTVGGILLRQLHPLRS